MDQRADEFKIPVYMDAENAILPKTIPASRLVGLIGQALRQIGITKDFVLHVVVGKPSRLAIPEHHEFFNSHQDPAIVYHPLFSNEADVPKQAVDSWINGQLDEMISEMRRGINVDRTVMLLGGDIDYRQRLLTLRSLGCKILLAKPDKNRTAKRLRRFGHSCDYERLLAARANWFDHEEARANARRRDDRGKSVRRLAGQRDQRAKPVKSFVRGLKKMAFVFVWKGKKKDKSGVRQSYQGAKPMKFFVRRLNKLASMFGRKSRKEKSFSRVSPLVFSSSRC